MEKKELFLWDKQSDPLPGMMKFTKKGTLMRYVKTHWQPVGYTYRDNKTGKFIKWEKI